MKKHYLAAVLIALSALWASSCAKPEPHLIVLERAMAGHSIPSAHDFKHRPGGLRNQVDDLFFRAEPSEVKAVLSAARFVRNERLRETKILDRQSFREFAGEVDPSRVMFFQREDADKDGLKHCGLVCSEDLSWVYLVYINFGND